MKLKFKDGTIVEVTETKGKSKEEIVAEAKKVYKDFKDSQVKDEEIISPFSLFQEIVKRNQANYWGNEREEYEKGEYGITPEQINYEENSVLNELNSVLNENIKLPHLIKMICLVVNSMAFSSNFLGDSHLNEFINKASKIFEEKCPNKFNILVDNYEIDDIYKFLEDLDDDEEFSSYAYKFQKEANEKFENPKSYNDSKEKIVTKARKVYKDFKDNKPISDVIDAEFVAEVNKEIGGRPFEFTEEEDGFADVLYVELDNTGKLVAGTATNAGIVADYGIPYDINISLDENLNKLYETIIETRNNEASIQDEEEVIEEEIEEV